MDGYICTMEPALLQMEPALADKERELEEDNVKKCNPTTCIIMVGFGGEVVIGCKGVFENETYFITKFTWLLAKDSYECRDTWKEIYPSWVELVVSHWSSNTKIFTPFDNPERQFRTKKNTTPLSVHNIYSFYESESSESKSEETGVIDIETLTLEQYLALKRGTTNRKERNPKDGNFEIKGQFLRELRDNAFDGNESKDAFEHLRKI
ncbi:hypothetical protein Tco_0828173 [Tanacetum coccineum]